MSTIALSAPDREQEQPLDNDTRGLCIPLYNDAEQEKGLDTGACTMLLIVGCMFVFSIVWALTDPAIAHMH